MRIAAPLALSLGALVSVVVVPERGALADSANPACSDTDSAALAAIGCELGARIFGLAPGAMVIGIAPATGSPSLGPGIGLWVAARLATALRGGAVTWPLVENGEHACTLPHGARPVVLVTPRLEGDRIVVSAEVLGPEPASASGKGGGPTLGRFEAKRSLDAEVRRFLPAVRLAIAGLEPLVGSDTDVLALACGDPKHEGPPSVATLSRSRVTLGTLSGSRYELRQARRWAELAPVASAPLREPIASLGFTPNGELLAGISDRASAVRLGAELGTSAPLDGVRLPWPGGGCGRIADLFVAPRIERCTKDERLAEQPSLRDPLDAFSGTSLVTRSGAVRVVRAGRRAADGSVTVTDGEHEARLEHAGAELALGDLDGDGTPELVTSVDTSDPRSDAVVVYSVGGSTLVERARVSIPTGVKALAVCPARANAVAPIVVATGNGVWVLR